MVRIQHEHNFVPNESVGYPDSSTIDSLKQPSIPGIIFPCFATSPVMLSMAYTSSMINKPLPCVKKSIPPHHFLLDSDHVKKGVTKNPNCFVMVSSDSLWLMAGFIVSFQNSRNLFLFMREMSSVP